MAVKRLYIAAYDIRHSRRLARTLKVLKEFSIGGQKSVFECFLDIAERQELVSRVADEIDHLEDSFLLVRLDPRSNIQAFGIAVKPCLPQFFSVD